MLHRLLMHAATISAMALAAPALANGSTSGDRAEASGNGDVMCIALYKPVCAVKDGRRKTYGNSCHAGRDNARIVSEGACPADARRDK